MADDILATSLADSNILFLLAKLKEECPTIPHPKVTKFQVRDAKLKKCITTINRIICEIWSWLDDFLARHKLYLGRQKQYMVVADYVNKKMLKGVSNVVYDRINQNDFEMYVNESLQSEQTPHSHISRGYSTSSAVPNRSPLGNNTAGPEASGIRSRRAHTTPQDFSLWNAASRNVSNPTIPHQTSDPTPLMSSNMPGPRPKHMYGAGPNNDFVLFPSPEQSRNPERAIMKDSNDQSYSTVPGVRDPLQDMSVDTGYAEQQMPYSSPNTRLHNEVSLGNSNSRGQKRGRDDREVYVGDRIISSAPDIRVRQSEVDGVGVPAWETAGKDHRVSSATSNFRSEIHVGTNKVVDCQSVGNEAVRRSEQDFAFNCKRAMTFGDGFISLDQVEVDGLAMTRTMSPEEVWDSVPSETRRVNRPSWPQPSKSVPIETSRRIGGSMPTTPINMCVNNRPIQSRTSTEPILGEVESYDDDRRLLQMLSTKDYSNDEKAELFDILARRAQGRPSPTMGEDDSHT